MKYGFDDVRNVWSARARGNGRACRDRRRLQGLPRGAGDPDRLARRADREGGRPRRRTPADPEDLDAVDASPVRCFDEAAGERMVAEIDRVRKARDTVGGEFEVIAYGCPPGLGSHVHYDRKLDARLALA